MINLKYSLKHRVTMPKFLQRIRNMRIWRNKRGSIGNTIIEMCLGMVLLGALAETAFGGLEAYVPTDPTLVLIWPLIAVFAALGFAYMFIKPILESRK